jgi:hypothetical protein
VTKGVRVFKAENQLAKVIQLPGGRTVAEALRSADERIGRLEPTCRLALRAKIVALSELSARQRTDDLDDIYGLANEIISLSGPAGMTELAKAAYCLCDLTDRFRTTGEPNWPAVTVHVGGLFLLSSDECDAGEQQRILAGLRQVSSRFVAASVA